MNCKTLILGLGSNIGDRKKNIRKAVGYLKKFFLIEKKSPLYETEPIGPEQPYFLNLLLQCKTTYTPYECLKIIKDIEDRMGREKTVRWGPRNIDIDIIFMENTFIKNDDLTIPHKELKNRRFFLEPLFYLGFNFKIDTNSVLFYLNKNIGQHCEKL